MTTVLDRTIFFRHSEKQRESNVLLIVILEILCTTSVDLNRTKMIEDTFSHFYCFLQWDTLKSVSDKLETNAQVALCNLAKFVHAEVFVSLITAGINCLEVIYENRDDPDVSSITFLHQFMLHLKFFKLFTFLKSCVNLL